MEIVKSSQPVTMNTMATSNNGNKQSWKPDIVVTNIKNLDERIFMSNLQNIIESKPD